MNCKTVTPKQFAIIIISTIEKFLFFNTESLILQKKSLNLQSQNAHSTKFAVVAQLVEHQLPKLRVAGSNPVYRSNRALEQTANTQLINSANHINPQKHPESFEGVFFRPTPKTGIILLLSAKLL